MVLKIGTLFQTVGVAGIRIFLEIYGNFQHFLAVFFLHFFSLCILELANLFFLYLYVEKSSSVESRTRCRRRIYPLLHCYVINQSASPTPHLVTVLLCYIFTLLHCYIPHIVTLLRNRLVYFTPAPQTNYIYQLMLHCSVINCLFLLTTQDIYQMSPLYLCVLQILTDSLLTSPNFNRISIDPEFHISLMALY